MTSRQNTVIWLGLVLIALNLIINIGEVKSVIFGTATTPQSSKNATNTPEGNTVNTPTPTPNASPTPASVQAPGAQSGVQAV